TKRFSSLQYYSNQRYPGQLLISGSPDWIHLSYMGTPHSAILQLALLSPRQESAMNRLADAADAVFEYSLRQLSELRRDPFDKSTQFIIILSLLRLVHDAFLNGILVFSSFGFLLTSLFLLRNHRFIWPFQQHAQIKKKAYSSLTSMLTHSLFHMFMASKTRCIFLDSLIALITFLTWNSQLELPQRVERPREQIRRAERG
ncbi:hypothetical protein PFISCL1PPCAC_17338, partial [Pristionchus fissidentatus]